MTPIRITAARLSVILVLLCGSYACQDDNTIVVPLELSAQDSEGHPLGEVQVWANGKALGETNDEGLLSTRIGGTIGKQVTLTRTCPQGYEAADQSRTLRISDTRGANNKRRAMQLRFECRASELLAALVVRAPNPMNEPMAIMVAGEVVGQTDADGVGHVLLRVPPASTVRVELDTTSAPELLPHNPVRTFQMHDKGEILRFDQVLTKPVPPAKKRHRVISHAPEPTHPKLPMRIR